MSVTTNGWGAVNIAPISVVNKSIAKQGKLPEAFTASSQGKILGETVSCYICGSKNDMSEKCSWEKWEIIPGGSGHIVKMSCTASTAFAHYIMTEEDGGHMVYDISGSHIDISLDLKAIVDPSYNIEGNSGTANVLMVKTDSQGPVNILNTTEINNLPNSGDTLIYYSMAANAFQNYFTSNLDKFEAVFGVIMLNAEIGEKDKAFQWLIPSAVSYACESNSADSYFGVLTMIDGQSIGTRSQQIDTRVFDKIPSGANSALLIGEDEFCKNILLPSAVAVITGSQASDFDIGSDKVSVTNNKDLQWDNFDTGNGKVITPTIPKESFDLRIVGSSILINITAMHYSPSPGITVTTSLTQQMELTIKKRSDGQCVIVPKKNSAYICKVNSGVQVSSTISIVEEIVGIVSLVAAVAFGIGAIAKGFAGAAETTTDAAAGAATIAIDAEKVVPAESELEDVLLESAESVESVASGTSTVTKGGFFTSNFCKVAAGISFGIGGVVGGITELIKGINDENYDKMPSLNEFGERLLGNFTWPKLDDAGIVDAELDDVLIMYTNITNNTEKEN